MAQERGSRNKKRDAQTSPSSDTTFYEKVVKINRISKTVAGGRRLRFSALIVVGDRNGRVGVALAKAREVPLAIDKARRKALRQMVKIPVAGTTIPEESRVKFKSAQVLLRPALRGRGIVANQTIRAIAEAAGIKDLVAKVIGSATPVNVATAVLQGLAQVRISQETISQ